MIEEIIYHYYGIQVEREEPDNRFPSFISGNNLYTIIPLETLDEDELYERQLMSEHLLLQGDRYVSAFVLAQHGSYVSEAEEQLFILLMNEIREAPRNQHLGRRMAKFHQRGRSINEPMKRCSRIGQWKTLWEHRIDQIEKLWSEKLHTHPSNEFERLFIETFPYYMVLGENAIQYLVDTEIDDEPGAVDSGTICYERFSAKTWGTEKCIKNPFDWLIDHGTRDVAEVTREHYFQNVHTHQRWLAQFFYDYQSVIPFSSFSARLLYSRMLFPIHYFETVEAYFANNDESRSNELEDRMKQYIRGSQGYEQFLKNFYDLAQIPAKYLSLPAIDWI
ncbi:spore coat putative kinase YutH [Bacillus massiliglaciei]|uniref:spore coat putative kinase YutH n=1 Tax=Bacillus massiliglaciei TaxID=1816693 RepID=UPI000AD0E459|nr:spore coat protein YutH [Bacillus massiliglaciei]